MLHPGRVGLLLKDQARAAGLQTGGVACLGLTLAAQRVREGLV